MQPLDTTHRLPSFASRLLMLALLMVGLAWSASAQAADDFLDPSQAFRGSARVLDAHTLEIRFDIEPGYHLYRDRFGFEIGDNGSAKLGTVDLPHGKPEYDEVFQKNLEVYRSSVVVKVPVSDATAPFRLRVNHQGCADKGLCYPPATAAADVQASGGSMTSVQWRPDVESAPAPAANGNAGANTSTGGAAASLIGATPAPAATTRPSAPGIENTPPAASRDLANDSDRIDAALRSGKLWTIAGVFLVAGVLLSFTPCVLPMVPILSSIIVGQGGPVSRARGFSLALAYTFGMALVYTCFGIAAGLAGEGLAAALQNPWVLGAFALLLSALALGMFGVFELQMPAALQSRLSTASARLPGGKFAGVFVMGGLSALIVGPCVAAPLAGALVYISQTRDVLIGGLALFALACGMSVPLLLVGLSAGTLLPRAGAWMESVKIFFGVLLLAVALWIVSPVLPAWALMLALGAGALLAAAYLRAFDRLPAEAGGWRRFGKGVGLLMMLLGAAQVIGALSGGDDALQPLKHWSAGSARSNGNLSAGGARADVATAGEGPFSRVSFQRVRSVAELDSALQTAGRPVMLDFYADWCVSCKEMEKFTFSDADVRRRLAGALLLQADVTANNADDKALLKRFELFGPPGIIFFDPTGREHRPARVIGFLPAERFGAVLASLGL